MKRDQLLTPEYRHRFIITTDATEIDTTAQLNDWLFSDMGDHGEKQYFPDADTLVCKIKNCKVFIVNKTPCACPNEKQ